jgi:hypothetical protein
VKALPRRHLALVLLEGVVPRLCGATEVVEGNPRAVGRHGPLPPEKLVEPVQGVDGAVLGGKFQLGEARQLLHVRRGRVGALVATHRGGRRVLWHHGAPGGWVSIPAEPPEGGGGRLQHRRLGSIHVGSGDGDDGNLIWVIGSPLGTTVDGGGGAKGAANGAGGGGGA